MEEFFSSGCSKAPQFRYALPDECVTKCFEDNSHICTELLPEVKRILRRVNEEYGGPEAFLDGQCYGGEKCSAEEMKEKAESYLKALNIEQRVDISINDGMLCCASVFNPGGSGKYVLNISSNPVSRSMVQSILDHEVGTHLLRMMNDESQPWHGDREHYSLSNPWTTEEGFATLNTYLSLPRKLLYPQALRYFAVCRGSEIGFVQLFRELQEHISDKTRCFQLCCRIKRGMFDTSLPGAFNIDQAYFKGAVEILRQLEDVDFIKLYGGQLSLQDLDKVHFVLRGYNVLLPKFMDSSRKLVEYKMHCRDLIRENQIESATACRPKFLPKPLDFFNQRSQSRGKARSASSRKQTPFGDSSANRRKDAARSTSRDVRESKSQLRHAESKNSLASPSSVPDTLRKPVYDTAESKVHPVGLQTVAKSGAPDSKRSQSVPCTSSSSSGSNSNSSSNASSSAGSKSTTSSSKGSGPGQRRPRQSGAGSTGASKGKAKAKSKCGKSSVKQIGADTSIVDSGEGTTSKSLGQDAPAGDGREERMTQESAGQDSSAGFKDESIAREGTDLEEVGGKGLCEDIRNETLQTEYQCGLCTNNQVDRPLVKCATVGCAFLIHSGQEFGGYCCRRCYNSGLLGKAMKNRHSSKCEKVFASSDTPTASAQWSPAKVIRWKVSRAKKSRSDVKELARCDEHSTKAQCTTSGTSDNTDSQCLAPITSVDPVDEGDADADANTGDADNGGALDSECCATTDVEKTDPLSKWQANAEQVETPVDSDSTQCSKLRRFKLKMRKALREAMPKAFQSVVKTPAPLTEAAPETTSAIECTGGGAPGNKGRELLNEASELLTEARELFGRPSRKGAKCAAVNCTYAVHSSEDFRGYCCKRCHNISLGKRYSMSVEAHSTKCECILAVWSDEPVSVSV